MILRVSHQLEGALQDDLYLDPGTTVVIESAPGKGVTVTVKKDGTLRIAVDMLPDEPPCLSVVK